MQKNSKNGAELLNSPKRLGLSLSRKPSHFLTQVVGARALASKKKSTVIPLCRTMEYKLAVDSSKKATELPLLRVCGTVQQNPHMRAFWASTISFFLAFLGCFPKIYYDSVIFALSGLARFDL